MPTTRLIVLSLIVLESVAVLAQSPVIVAQVSLRNQNRSIRPTALVTPTTGGVYRISAYMATAKASFHSSWATYLNWTDDYEHTFQSVPVTVGGDKLYSQAIVIVRGASNVPITYSVGFGGELAQPYDLFITVEQLESD
jgi:hypothetical protein